MMLFDPDPFDIKSTRHPKNEKSDRIFSGPPQQGLNTQSPDLKPDAFQSAPRRLLGKQLWDRSSKANKSSQQCLAKVIMIVPR